MLEYDLWFIMFVNCVFYKIIHLWTISQNILLREIKNVTKYNETLCVHRCFLRKEQ